MQTRPILIALIALIIAALACGESTPEVEKGEPAATEEPTEATPLPSLGDTVEQDGYSLSATQVADPATPGMLYDEEPGTRLVAVEIVVGNTGREEVSANPLYASLIDAEGYSHSVELAAVDNQIDTVTLGEGEKVKGWVGFVIPEDAEPAVLKYEFGMIGAPTLRVSLTE